MNRLSPDEVHVWTACREAPDSMVEAMRALLDVDELKRADRFAFPRDRRQFAVGRGLLRTILGRYLDRPSESLRFVANAHGKPGLDPRMGVDVPDSFQPGALGPLGGLRPDAGAGDRGRHRAGFAPSSAGSRSPSGSSPPARSSRAPRPCPRRRAAWPSSTAGRVKKRTSRPRGRAWPCRSIEFEVAIAPDQPAALLSTLPDPLEASRWSLVELARRAGLRRRRLRRRGAVGPSARGPGRRPAIGPTAPSHRRCQPPL